MTEEQQAKALEIVQRVASFKITVYMETCPFCGAWEWEVQHKPTCLITQAHQLIEVVADTSPKNDEHTS